VSKRRAGSIVLIGGGVLFLVALAVLPYVEESFAFGITLHPTLWDLMTRLPVVLTAVAALAIMFALWGLLGEARVPTLLATCCSFYLWGEVFQDGARHYSEVGAGLWLATAAAIVMSTAGVLAVVGGFAASS
jgi:hypothetical protein